MKKGLFLLVAILWAIAGCGTSQTAEPVNLVLMTHDSFEIGAETLAQFSEETGITVEIFKAGDAGEMVNKAVLAKDAPLADVLFGVDNTFLSRALDNDIFLPHESEALAVISPELRLDEQNRAIPIDYSDVCLNYDRGWFADAGIAPPADLEDLIDPVYAGLTVVQNPATSSPGLAFLLATIDTYSEGGYLDYWAALVENDVLVTSGWEDAYFGQFTGASDGDRPIVVSYASSPPAEVLFADPRPEEAPTASVTAPGSCFRQIEFAGILNGTEHSEAAGQLIDFMLSKTFQDDIPLNMFVYPASTEATLPEEFVTFGQLAEQPAVLDPAAIAENREKWIEAWTETVLR
ncbi:MAG: thiamine ABC transporter substrate-binding protein [Ardenticatenaceae bacterium]|nr:thiamine ABC transporter substrate-binding protein [Ardenticatenaceae bacterium]